MGGAHSPLTVTQAPLLVQMQAQPPPAGPRLATLEGTATFTGSLLSRGPAASRGPPHGFSLPQPTFVEPDLGPAPEQGKGSWPEQAWPLLGREVEATRGSSKAWQVLWEKEEGAAVTKEMTVELALRG